MASFPAGALGAGATIASGPVATTGPTLIGTAAAGKRLTGLSGTWAGFGPITYRFQWFRCNAAGAQCRSIRGSVSPTYELAAKDIGKTVGLAVSGTDSTGTAVVYSSLIGPIAPSRPLLEATVQPTVNGPPVEGKTVQVTTGTWSPVPARISYSWDRCNANGRVCAAIPNATGNTTYTIGAQDLGHALLAVVQGVNGTVIQNAFSTATPAVVDGSVMGPVLVAEPTLVGAAVQGQQLSANTGIWRGVGPVMFTYLWYRCDTHGSHCTTIHNASGSSYTLAARDSGHTIALTLRATDSTGATAAYAPLVGPVAPANSSLTPSTLPTVSGTATTGGALRVVDGLWSTVPTSYAYAWLRCNRNGRICIAIPGATAPSYTVTRADRAHTLIVDVTALAGADSQSALTAATARVS